MWSKIHYFVERVGLIYWKRFLGNFYGRKFSKTLEKKSENQMKDDEPIELL
ncbi:hypothetical protein WUBG_05200, partial [Wuchereria bancrofti]